MGDVFKKNWKTITNVRPDALPTSQNELAKLTDSNGYGIVLPSGASLAAKIAVATVPAGWTLVLANDGSVDAQIASAASDLAVLHDETGRYAAHIDVVELDNTTGGASNGYFLVGPTGVFAPSNSKSNTAGTQFSILDFTGMITLGREQRINVRLLPI